MLQELCQKGKTVQTFSCVAELENHIVALAHGDRLRAGVIGDRLRAGVIVGCWDSTGSEIRIAGRYRTTGYFPRWCVRWLCDAHGDKGLFGKGLAGYSGTPLTLAHLKHLPIVR